MSISEKKLTLNYVNNLWGATQEILSQKGDTLKIYEILQLFFYELSLVEKSYSSNIENALEMLDIFKDEYHYQHPKNILELIFKIKLLLKNYSVVHYQLSEHLLKNVEDEKETFKGTKQKFLGYVEKNNGLINDFAMVQDSLEKKKKECC